MLKRCIIVDDEPHCAALLERYIGRTAGLVLVKIFNDPAVAQEWVRDNPFDIIFLDIEMPGMSGLAFAEHINDAASVIFTTGHPEFGAAAYRQNAIDYLLKPIRYGHFLEAINKVNLIDRQVKKAAEYFYAKETLGGKLVKINLSEILYVESAGNYIKIILVNNRFYLVHSSLNKLNAALSGGTFAQIHRSLVINMHHVQSLEGNIVTLSEDHKLQVGNSFRKGFLALLGCDMI